MAKVILLNSSPRANSNTQDVLEVCAEEIEKNGVEAEIISLRGKQIQSCVACNGCAKTGNCVLMMVWMKSLKKSDRLTVLFLQHQFTSELQEET